MEITTSELETRAGRLRPFCNRHSDQAASSSELKTVQNRTAGPVKSYYTFTGTVIKGQLLLKDVPSLKPGDAQ